MKIKYILLFLVCCLTAAPMYGENTNGSDTCWLFFGDSVLLEADEAAEVSLPHFFIPQLQEACGEINRAKPAFDWFFVVLLCFCCLLAFVRLQNPNVFLLLWQVIGKKKPREVFLKRDYASKNFLSLLLMVCSWMGFALALAEVLAFFGAAFPMEPLFFAFACLFFYYTGRYILRMTAMRLFQIGDLVVEYRQMSVSANFVGTLLTLPLVTINHYVPNAYLVWIICGFFGVYFIQKIFFVWIVFSKKLHGFEILLYLCTLELLPLLLCARYLFNYFIR